MDILKGVNIAKGLKMVDFGAKFKGKESLEIGDRHFSKDDTAKQSEFGGGG